MKFAVPFPVLKSEDENKAQIREFKVVVLIKLKLGCFVNMRLSKNILSKAQDDLISIARRQRERRQWR